MKTHQHPIPADLAAEPESFSMPKLTEQMGDMTQVVSETDHNVLDYIDLAPEKDISTWWAHPRPLAENCHPTFLLRSDLASVPLDSQIAKMHPIYENRVFSAVQLENYAVLTKPAVYGCVKGQPMPLNILKFILKEVKQLILRNKHVVFNLLAIQVEKTQVCVDHAVDALLDATRLAEKSHVAQQKISSALDEVLKARQMLISSTEEMLRAAVVIKDMPIVQDAILLSVPQVMQSIIDAQIKTLQYCAAMLHVMILLNKKINEFASAPAKKENHQECAEILQYVQTHFAPLLVRDSYKLLGGKELAIKGTVYPFGLMLSTAGVAEKTYTFSMLLHVTKEHVLASFVPYIRVFTQPDSEFASQYSAQVDAWEKAFRRSSSAESKEDKTVLHKIVMKAQDQSQVALVDSLIQQAAQIEEVLVNKLYVMMNPNANNQQASFCHRLENIHQHWSELMQIDENVIFWEKDRKLRARLMLPLSKNILVDLRVAHEARKLCNEQLPIWIYPFMSAFANYDALLKISRFRMQWYDTVYLFRADHVYRINQAPFAPRVLEDPTVRERFVSSVAPAPKLASALDAKHAETIPPSLVEVKYQAEVPLAKLTLKAVELVDNMKRVVFSLKTTASQYQNFRQQLVLKYSHVVDHAYFTPFEPANKQCHFVLLVPESKDILEILRRHDFVRHLIVDQFPHQDFSDFITRVEQDLKKCLPEKSVKKPMDEAYFDYANYAGLDYQHFVGSVESDFMPPVDEKSVDATIAKDPDFLCYDIISNELTGKLKPNAIYGIFFKFRKNSDPNFKCILDQGDYSQVIPFEQTQRKLEVLGGSSSFKYTWRGKTEVSFYFIEKRPFRNKTKEEKSASIMQYANADSTFVKSKNKFLHLVIGMRREHMLVFPKAEKVTLDRVEIWEMNDKNPHSKEHLIHAQDYPNREDCAQIESIEMENLRSSSALVIFKIRAIIEKSLSNAFLQLIAGVFHDPSQLHIRQHLQDRSLAPFLQNENFVVQHDKSRFASLLDALARQIQLPEIDEIIKEILNHLEEYADGNFVQFSFHCLSSIRQMELLYLKSLVRLTQVSIRIHHNDKGKTFVEVEHPKKIIVMGYVVGVCYVGLDAAMLQEFERQPRCSSVDEATSSVMSSTKTLVDMRNFENQLEFLPDNTPIFSGDIKALQMHFNAVFVGKEVDCRHFLQSLGIGTVRDECPLEMLKRVFDKEFEEKVELSTLGCTYEIKVGAVKVSGSIANKLEEKQEKARELIGLLVVKKDYWRRFLPQYRVDVNQVDDAVVRNFIKENSIFHDEMRLCYESRAVQMSDQSSCTYHVPFYQAGDRKIFIGAAINANAVKQDDRVVSQVFAAKIMCALSSLSKDEAKPLTDSLMQAMQGRVLALKRVSHASEASGQKRVPSQELQHQYVEEKLVGVLPVVTYNPLLFANHSTKTINKASTQSKAHSVVFYERILQLRKKIGANIDVELLKQALTNYGEECHAKKHQRLEFLGDAFLGYAMSVYLCVRFPKFDAKQYVNLIQQYTSNPSLSRRGAACQLYRYLHDSSYHSEAALSSSLGNIVNGTPGEESTRLLANTVEAVIGAAFLSGGEEMAKLTMAWFGLPSDMVLSAEILVGVRADESGLLVSSEKEEAVPPKKIDEKYLVLREQIPEIEKQMAYTFKNKDLLIQSMTGDDCSPSSNGALPNWRKMSFLGSAIAKLIAAYENYSFYPDATEGVMTQLRVDSDRMECVSAWRNHFHSGLLLSSGNIKSLHDYAVSHQSMEAQWRAEKGKNKSESIAMVTAQQKGLAGTLLNRAFNARIAAIFIDSNYSLGTVMQVVRRLKGMPLPLFNYLADHDQNLYSKVSNSTPSMFSKLQEGAREEKNIGRRLVR